MGPVILAIAAAELATAFAWVSGGSLEVMRSVVLVAGVAVSIVLLVAELRCERLRAELRRHAGVGQQLQQAKTAADEASRVKSDFLAVMSHEMRTPLNAVTGFATLLRETRLDDAQRDYVRTIAGEAARLTSLINDILDLTKIEEGRLTLERLPFAPVETGQEVLRLLQNRAAEQKLDLRFEPLLTSPLLVAGDPLRFRQVLLNLIDNAVKFTARGSVTLYLSWKPPAEPGETGELGVTVKDTGIGIPASKLNNLFQMFMQVDTSTTRRYGGTGLGLAICQRLVRLMGGEISVRSTVGEGSEFSFSLPVTAVAAPVATVEIDPPPAPASSRRPRVLVVDDMETNRFLLEIFLRRHGFDPDVASGGEEAIALAAKKPYDAILMDLQMPDLDGYTAARRIREAETGGQHTPILALTASIAKGTRDKCLAAGMDEHLTKPLDLRRFKELLDGYITTRTKPNPARHGPAHTARC
ncbi:MAG: ATP-binding protein [Opitutaceae bacterium]|nr:ATP-binding protein [Opitutaceae bacterium]